MTFVPDASAALEEILDTSESGRGVIFLPTAISEAFPRPYVAYVPITDIPPGQVALAWLQDEPTPLLADFVQAATRAS